MSSKIKHGTGFLTCQFVEDLDNEALLEVELGLQGGKDSVEGILGVIGGQAGGIKEAVRSVDHPHSPFFVLHHVVCYPIISEELDGELKSLGIG